MKHSDRSWRAWVRRAMALLAVTAVAVAASTTFTEVASADLPAPGDDRVLIYGPSVSGGSASEEATAATNLGFTVDVVDGPTWAAMTADQFDDYRALILGDPTCSGGYLGDAESNATVWGGVVDGNVVINNTDPVFHSGQGGAALTANSVAFAVDEAGKTGLYASLSCDIHFRGADANIDVLAGLGTFGDEDAECWNDAHIVATHPAIAGMTDADLSNWSCSVHGRFTTWPSDFQVLVIAEDAAGPYTAGDGSVGFPYVLARGEGLTAISDISLAPGTDTNPVGADHTVTATVVEGEPGATTPVEGAEVTFEVLSGPHAGTTGTGTTDAAGEATFTYTGTAAGTDTIQARFTDSEGVLQRSNIVEKVWEGTVVIDESVSGTKYYDANANGQWDAGEPGIGGWPVDLGGDSAAQTLTDPDGAYSFDVDPGTFTLAERQAAAPWMQTGNVVDQSTGTGDVTLNADKTYTVALDAGEAASDLDFGNLCIGGVGAKTKGFWQNKNGQTAFMGTDSGAGALALLNGLNLKDADGDDADFGDYGEFRDWIRKATAKNSAYMLSAQLAAMALNEHAGYIDGADMVQAAGATSANPLGFASVDDLIAEADAALGAATPDRDYQLLLSGIIDAANNDRSFVERAPGDCPAPRFSFLFEDDFDAENAGVGVLNYTGFANWGVTDGTVDLIGNGFFDFYPGNGLYVDLDGSTDDAGILTTTMTFALPEGSYELSFDLGGSQRGDSNDVTVTLGGLYTDTFTLASADPLSTVSVPVAVPAGGALVTLSFENAGGDNVGAIVDNVSLASIG